MTYDEWREEVMTAVQLGIPYFAEAVTAIEVQVPKFKRGEVKDDSRQDQ